MGYGREVEDALRGPARQLRDAIPEVWSARTRLSAAVMVDGALDVRTKELIALAVSVTRECDGCIAAHAKGAARAGASREEVAERLGVTVMMNGGPATVWGPRAFDAFLEYSAGRDDDGQG